jgi:hypothetical protein
MGKNAQQDPAVTAMGALTSEVYLPAFVEKCAAAGLQFPDDESLNAALESVAMLKAAEAEEATDLTKSARADLGALFGETAEPQPVITEDDMQKAAAVANSENVRNAFAALAAMQQAE